MAKIIAEVPVDIEFLKGYLTCLTAHEGTTEFLRATPGATALQCVPEGHYAPAGSTPHPPHGQIP